MATKEDILEQIVEEFLTHKGYFVRHNIKYLPDRLDPGFESKKDSNHSDIDVLGYNPRLEGHEKVWVVNCKSWQSGFDAKKFVKLIESDGKNSGRPVWKGFRELTKPKWSTAFRKAIRDATGSDSFTYFLAVTHVVGDKENWEGYKPFSQAMAGNPIRLISFQEMIKDINSKLTKTLAATEVGRMLQLFRASNLMPS